MEYDAQLLIGRTVTMAIAKTSRHTVFREYVVKRFFPDEGIWLARDTRTRQREYFDLADIIEGHVRV
jgi:hypothetical protein